MIKKYLILCLIFASISFATVAYAQVRDGDISLNISPANPNPNENVTATLNSYVITLDNANISWSVEGQEMSSGIGKKSFSFNSGSLGSQLNLTATINTVDGQTITKSVTITPAGLDILWEGVDSYTPPFYKGKTLVANQGAFKVVAMPTLNMLGGRVSPNNLSYKWGKDGSGAPNASGWGKSYYIFRNSYLDRENEVEVEVKDILGSTSATGKIDLQTVDPKIVFYKKSPLTGTRLENSIKDGAFINGSGETLVAVPYFFSPKNIARPELTFDWLLNNQKVETPDSKNTLSIKTENGESGTARIKVVINNINTLFQSMEKEINVSF